MGKEAPGVFIMTMRIFSASALCLLTLSAPAFAAPPKAPVAAVESQKAVESLRWPAPTQTQLDAARAQAQANPESADAQFELAMVYARTCFLEEGWEALKRVQVLDAAYADKVVERFGALTEADPNDLDSRF